MTATRQVFRLPDLGEGLTEAEVLDWKVAVGDTVEIDQIVVEVETAKAAVEVPIPYAGTVLHLHAAPGTVLPVGAPLIEVGPPTAKNPAPAAHPATNVHSAAGEDAATDPHPLVGEDPAAARYREEEQAGSGNVLIGYGTGRARSSRRRPSRTAWAAAPQGPGVAPDGSAVAPQVPASQVPASQVPASQGSAVASRDPEAAPQDAGTSAAQFEAGPQRAYAPRVISPLVRRFAREHGVDLATITPTGPRGVILRRDVEQAIAGQPREAPTTPPATGTALAAERVPLRGLRRAVADKVSRSRREIPDATTWVDADATGLLAVKDALKQARPDLGIGLLALLARICVSGLRRYPELNSSIDTERAEIVRYGHINLGFAAQTDRGLVVPVVRDAHLMTTEQLAAELTRLTTLAREGGLPPTALTGGTFTLNNYGVFGVDGSTPIINHPEAALLGVGRVIDRPWVRDGAVVPRKVTQLSFTFDHRVCDGGTAGGFLRFVADCVENPSILLAHV